MLADTLSAFREQSRPPDSVLVIDNGAEDTVRELVAGIAGTEYRAMPENLGPAGGFAVGMGTVLDRATDEDWVLLIDDDDPPLLDTALEDVFSVAVRAPVDVAVVGLTGSRYDRWTGRLHRVTDDQLDHLTDVDYVGNNQVPLYRVRAIREVGVFDPGIFIFSEELDLGMRLKAAGWRIIISRPLTLRQRAASGRLGLGRRASNDRRAGHWRSYYAARNEVVVARRYGHLTAPLIVTLRSLVGGMAKAARTRSMSVLGPRVRGLVDGWRGRLGCTLEP